MRTPIALPSLALALGLLWACTTPTEMCACPPSRSTLVVTGTLRDALGAPLVNTLFALEAMQDSTPFAALVSSAEVRTDATGTFATRLYSVLSPASQRVVARIIRAPQGDTIRIGVGSGAFKNERQIPDTLRVTVQLP